MNSNFLISGIYSELMEDVFHKLLFSGRLRDHEFQSRGANRTFFLFFLFSLGWGSVAQIHTALVKSILRP